MVNADMSYSFVALTLWLWGRRTRREAPRQDQAACLEGGCRDLVWKLSTTASPPGTAVSWWPFRSLGPGR